MFSTEEYMGEHKVIRLVFDEMQNFMAFPQHTVLLRQNKNKIMHKVWKLRYGTRETS